VEWSDVTVLYQTGTVVMAAVCLLAVILDHEAVDLAGAAMTVFVFTVMSRMVSADLDPPWSMAHWPVQDLICVGVAWWGHRRSPRWWTRSLAQAFTIQLGAHVLYWGVIFLKGSASWIETVSYLWIINGLFVIELLILTGAGGGRVADHVRARVRLLHRGASVPASNGRGR
jgi:hypothetical protein